MKKPSERMHLISKELGFKDFPNWNDTMVIMKYLDEEYEKQSKVCPLGSTCAIKNCDGLVHFQV